MAKRSRNPRPASPAKARPLQKHLLGTMFDPTRTIERVLSTGTVVRMRIEEIDGSTVMVHEALRRRADGPWVRWPEFEGVQHSEKLFLDQWRAVPDR